MRVHQIPVSVVGHAQWLDSTRKLCFGIGRVIGIVRTGEFVNGLWHLDDNQCHLVGHREGEVKGVVCVWSGDPLGRHQVGGGICRMSTLVVLRLPSGNQRGEELRVGQGRACEGCSLSAHIRLVGIVEVVVLIRQSTHKRCRIFRLPHEVARGGILLGGQLHVGIEGLSAAHHVEAAGIAFGEFGGVAVLHRTGSFAISRRVTSVGNGDGELLCLVLQMYGRELFLRAGCEQQEQCGLQEWVYVLFLHIHVLNGLNESEGKDGTHIEIVVLSAPVTFHATIGEHAPVPYEAVRVLRRRPNPVIVSKIILAACGNFLHPCV